MSPDTASEVKLEIGQSALSKALRRKTKVKSRNFVAELERGNMS
jgi:hypothetical protein